MPWRAGLVLRVSRPWRFYGCLLALIGGVCQIAVARPSVVPLETVHFEIDVVTTFGDSVFALGDIPELGGGDMTRAVKLVPGTYDPGPPASLVWSIDIAVPQGTTFEYAFVVRADAVSSLSNPANGTPLTGPQMHSTADPTPPIVQLQLFRSLSPPASDVTFNTASGPVVVPLKPVPGHPDLQVATLDSQPNGGGIDALVNGNSVITSLQTILRRGAQVYNYVSISNTDVNGTRELLAVPSAYVVATRTVGGVTGRGVEVWLPRGYSVHTDRHYPVLYMHDGQNVFIPGGPFGTWAAEQVAAGLIRAGQVREMIIVAIDNSSDRLAEYNPHWSGSKNAAYNSFVVQELKPEIDARYRTLAGPTDTGVIGSSFGGIASLSLGLDHADVFGRVGAMSTSFWATTLGNRLAAGELPAFSVLYLDAGDQNDGAASTIAVRDALLASGRVLEANLFLQIGYGQGHNEAAWHDRFDEALLALFPVTAEANTIDLPVPIPGDVDGDGCVDLTDLARLLAAFGRCTGQVGFDADADVDGSGCVDLSDLAILLGAFGSGCP